MTILLLSNIIKSIIGGNDMALKKELDKKTKGKSKVVLLCTFPVLLVGAITGVIFNHFNSNNKNVAKSDEKEYQYDYEYKNCIDDLRCRRYQHPTLRQALMF